MTKCHLTRAQLLQEWRLRALPEPVNATTAGIERIDGIDLDRQLEARMDDWYADLLCCGPLELQAPVDMADKLVAMESAPPGANCYRLPDGFQRMVCLQVEGCSRCATLLQGAAARLYRPSRRLVDDSPVALIDGPYLIVYPKAPLRAAIMVCDTADGIYHLDSAALKRIEAWY